MKKIFFLLFILIELGQTSNAQPTWSCGVKIHFHLYDKGVTVNAKDAFLKYNCPPFDGWSKNYANGNVSLFPPPSQYYNLYGVKMIDTASYHLLFYYSTSNVSPGCTFQLYTTNPSYLTKKDDLMNPNIKDKMVIDYRDIASTDIVHLDSLNFKPGYFKLVYSTDTTPYTWNYLQYGRNFKRVRLIEVDSCILNANTFNLNEKIEFTAKVATTRQVGTMSCSCGNMDFYYKVYSLEKDGWKLFIDHTEEGKDQCLCLSMRAEIINGNKYSIQSIKKTGTYYIEIKGDGFVINSMAFTVKE